MFKEKWKKWMKVGAAIVLTSTIVVLGMTVPQQNTYAADATKNATGKAALTKVLEYAATTTLKEDFSFSFTFEKKSLNDDDSAAIKATMPDLGKGGKVTVTVNDDKANAVQATSTADGKKKIAVESENFLEGVTFPHAGIYKYTVTEDPRDPAQTNDPVTYSQAQYTIEIAVKNSTDDAGKDTLVVDQVNVVKDKDDEGKSDGVDTNAKVDSTPGKIDNGGGSGTNNDEATGVEQEANDDGSGTSRYSKMIFTNTYAPTLTETAPTEDDKQDEEVSGSNHRFYIQKTVTGDYGDKTKAFTFKITVSRDALDKSTGTIYGYLMTWNGSKWVVDTGNQSGNVTGTSAGVTAIEFTADTEKDVYMTDGQRLVFTTVADGTKITVKEVGESKYKGKVDTLSGSSNDAEVAGSFGTAGSDTSVSAAQSGTVGGTAVTTGALVVGGTKNNYAKFTNDSSENILPNTGIILDNLPYFMLILVALVLAFAYVYVKSRNKKEGHRLS